MRQLINAVLIAALMIVSALALQWLHAHGVVPGDRQEMAERSLNVMMGLLVVGMANLAPKRMKPLSETVCDPAREQANRRFSGRVFVAGGLFFTLAWLAAPIALALPLSMAAMAAALMVVMAQCLLITARR
jgi:hypothetical protein